MEVMQQTRALAEARARSPGSKPRTRRCRRRAGGARALASATPTFCEGSDAAAYRSEDPLLRLERDLHAANVAIANLSIENAILQSRASGKKSLRLSPVRAALAAGVIAVVGGGIWWATENFGLLLVAGLLLLHFGVIYSLIGSIQPNDSNGRPPLRYPGSP